MLSDTVSVVYGCTNNTIRCVVTVLLLPQHLSEMGSYNTMLAVVGGLNHFSIKRLLQTWSKVDSKRKDVSMHAILNSSTFISTVRSLSGMLAFSLWRITTVSIDRELFIAFLVCSRCQYCE